MPKGVPDSKLDVALDKEKLRALRLANDEKEGELVVAKDVERHWMGFLADLRTHLEALPARVAGGVETPPKVLVKLRELIDDMVDDLGVKFSEERRSRVRSDSDRNSSTGRFVVGNRAGVKVAKGA